MDQFSTFVIGSKVAALTVVCFWDFVVLFILVHPQFIKRLMVLLHVRALPPTSTQIRRTIKVNFVIFVFWIFLLQSTTWTRNKTIVFVLTGWLSLTDPILLRQKKNWQLILKINIVKICPIFHLILFVPTCFLFSLSFMVHGGRCVLHVSKVNNYTKNICQLLTSVSSIKNIYCYHKTSQQHWDTT